MKSGKSKNKVYIGVALAVFALSSAGKTAQHAVSSSAAHAAHEAHLAQIHVSRGGTAAVVSFVQSKLGGGYSWGGNGPADYDCSGLAAAAWGAAGVSIPRTSETEWASLPHVGPNQVHAGDLVFFPGSDGTWTSPGHVGVVTDPAKHLMINAYSTSRPIEYDVYGSGATLAGLNHVVGFARPGG